MDGRDADGKERNQNDSPKTNTDSDPETLDNSNDLDLLRKSKKEFQIGRKLAFQNIHVTTNEVQNLKKIRCFKMYVVPFVNCGRPLLLFLCKVSWKNS